MRYLVSVHHHLQRTSTLRIRVRVITKEEVIAWLQADSYTNLTHFFWRSVTDAFSKHLGIPITPVTTVEQVRDLLAGVEMRVDGAQYLMLGVTNCPDQDRPWSDEEVANANFEFALCTFEYDPTMAN